MLAQKFASTAFLLLITSMLLVLGFLSVYRWVRVVFSVLLSVVAVLSFTFFVLAIWVEG